MPVYLTTNAGDNTAPNTSVSDSVIPNGNSSAAFIPSTMNEKEIFFFTDDEDIRVRVQGTAGALDEIWQAMLQNNCTRTKSTQPARLRISPKFLDTISQDAIAQETTGAISQEINSLPKPSTWFSTKVFASDATSGTVQLNLNQKYLGMKYYVYDPYNTGITTSSYAIGMLRFTYHWAFKDLDNRALVTTVTLSDPTQLSLSQQAQARRLLNPHGTIPVRHPGSRPFTKLARLVDKKRGVIDSGDSESGDRTQGSHKRMALPLQGSREPSVAQSLQPNTLSGLRSLMGRT